MGRWGVIIDDVPIQIESVHYESAVEVIIPTAFSTASTSQTVAGIGQC